MSEEVFDGSEELLQMTLSNFMEMTFVKWRQIGPYI
jgi:hypothetical protein